MHHRGAPKRSPFGLLGVVYIIQARSLRTETLQLLAVFWLNSPLSSLRPMAGHNRSLQNQQHVAVVIRGLCVTPMIR